MIVAALALDRFDNDRGDVDPASIDEFRISASDFFSRSITSASRSFSGKEKSIAGFETRGQLNLANKSVFRGSYW